MIATSISGVSDITRSMTDPELMCAIRDGEGEALAVLIHRHARLVFRVAANILRDRGEAEDSTQEIFLEIYRKAHLYDPARGSVKGWLLQYAYRRSLRRRTTLTRRAAYRSEPIESADDVRQVVPRLTVEECRWVLRSGLAQLPEKQRTTLELTCFEDLPLRDVAGRLGVSVGCTRHYYYRGLARLQAWARISARLSSAGCRNASSGDRAGGATAEVPPPPARRGTRDAPAPPRSPRPPAARLSRGCCAP
jgi:RNA polymerase sigma-70 factor (ECF subfamily)